MKELDVLRKIGASDHEGAFWADRFVRQTSGNVVRPPFEGADLDFLEGRPGAVYRWEDGAVVFLSPQDAARAVLALWRRLYVRESITS